MTDEPGQVHNEVSGPVGGLFQAGVVHGDVHLHPAPPPITPKVPRQLPKAPHGFVGRRNHLAALDEAPSLVVISAAGGVGKSWLALTWAHQAADRFPDGQLFADLRGFSPTGPPVDPADALGGFLEALGVARDRQPKGVDRRSDLFRSLLSGKRMLVVLDNAATTDQVLPLLPGTSTCSVLVTSRDHLRGLVARHGASPVFLDVFTDVEARTLVTGAEPAVTELITLCGGFPLALGLIAARSVTEPHLPLQDIVDELRDLGPAALDSDDPTASLPAVLSWSLDRLTDRQREAFTLLGTAPGPDISFPAAAALLGLTIRESRLVLRSLADVSLINRAPGGRFAMHDLVRAYAGSLSDDRTARHRILDFYLHTAIAANHLLAPYGTSIPLDPPVPGVRAHPLPDATAALAWFDTEHACLLAAQRAADGQRAWQLAWGLHTFHGRRGHLHDQLAVWQIAAGARLADPIANIRIQRYLGVSQGNLNHHKKAIEHLQLSLDMAEQQQDTRQQAHTTIALSTAWTRQGDNDRALDTARRSAALFRAAGAPLWEARALSEVGGCLARQGDYDSAREHCEAALASLRRHGDTDGEAHALAYLGLIAHCTGRQKVALDLLVRCIQGLQQVGDTSNLAPALGLTGEVLVTVGRNEQARTAWRLAIDLFRAQGREANAEAIKQRLADWSD